MPDALVGFLGLLGLSAGLFGFVVLATLVHEVGHAVACLLVGGRPEVRMWADADSPCLLAGPIGLRVGLRVMRCRCENVGETIVVGPRLLAYALGGPLASGVLTAALLLWMPVVLDPVAEYLVAVAALQAVGNLVPMGKGDVVSDGMHALRSLRAMRTPAVGAVQR